MKARIVYLLACLMVCSLGSYAQEKAIVVIEHADSLRAGTRPGDPNRFIGNAMFSHKDMRMTCDSLYQYPDSNFIYAYGRVHAVQNDTINMWGDYLFYNGNTEVAKVRHNVVLQDPQLTLTTDSLNYDAFNRVGHYFNGGTIRDSVNTLVSDIGYYYLPINEMFYKDNVEVYTPDYTLYSDTLKYQTQTKVITILGPTNIIGDNRTLYSEYGWYNSITSHAELYKNNTLTYNNYIGSSDTLVVDSVSGTAIMRQHIHLYDTINKAIVEGNYGEVLRDNDYAFVTERAMLILVGQSDSLFMHADTLSISKDSLENNVMKAYYGARFYSLDLQGVCDSIVYPVADSTIYLYRQPVIWASGNQLTGTTIDMHMVDNEVDKFNMRNKAMIVSMVDSTMYKLTPDQRGVLFNQVKGRDMTGYVRDNQLYLMYVDGSGESAYYPDDNGIIIGLNKATSSNIKIELENKKIKDITFINDVEGTLNPLFMVTPEDGKLRDFQWHIEKKPLKKEDIFLKTPQTTVAQDSVPPAMPERQRPQRR